PPQCEAWCQQFGFQMMDDGDGHNYPDLADQRFTKVEWSHPVDSGAKVALARCVSEAMGGGDALLWIRNWEIWPSSAHLPLFARLRQALGATRSPAEAPGQLVGGS